jgi:exonuclease III
MKTQVVTWNIRRRKAQTIWQHLPDCNMPGIALLQEVSTNEPESPHFVRHEIHSRHWGTGILTKDIPLQPSLITSTSHPGTITAAQINPSGEAPITFISLYGLMENRHSITTLHRIFSDLTPILARTRKRLILGGDFNASPAFDRPPQFQSHRILFERVKDFGLVDCLPDVSVWTWRSSKNGWQLDYLFASHNIAEKLVECRIPEDMDWASFSDHKPITAVFDF